MAGGSELQHEMVAGLYSSKQGSTLWSCFRSGGEKPVKHRGFFKQNSPGGTVRHAGPTIDTETVVYRGRFGSIVKLKGSGRARVDTHAATFA